MQRARVQSQQLRVPSCYVVSCRVVSCRVPSCRVGSCPVTSRHVTSRHVTSRHVALHHVASRHIMLCAVTSSVLVLCILCLSRRVVLSHVMACVMSLPLTPWRTLAGLRSPDVAWCEGPAREDAAKQEQRASGRTERRRKRARSASLCCVVL